MRGRTAEHARRAAVRGFDLLSDQVVQVIEVAPNSVAERNGIQSGDFIVPVNDHITSGVDDIHRLLSLVPHEVPLDVTLIRGREKCDLYKQYSESLPWWGVGRRFRV